MSSAQCFLPISHTKDPASNPTTVITTATPLTLSAGSALFSCGFKTPAADPDGTEPVAVLDELPGVEEGVPVLPPVPDELEPEAGGGAPIAVA